MMRASYFDPANDKAVEIGRCSGADAPGLIDAILALRSRRGHPTLELTTAHGATLSLSTDGELAYLVWTGTLGGSLHSVGNDQDNGEPLVFDYFGSWSEAARQHLVSLEDAVLCTQRFALTGTADTDRVLFEPD
jgi:hypothetical protein